MNEPKRRGSCISNPEDKTKIQTEDLQKNKINLKLHLCYQTPNRSKTKEW